MKAMILRVVFSLFFVSMVSSELELCGDPKIDSIEYIPQKSTWFFTSQGYYWYIKETDFPPKKATGKLPKGFSRGDGAIYMDYYSVCKGVANAKTDQVIILVELVGDENKYIEFDTKSNKWSSSGIWSALPLSHANLDINKQILAMFSLNGNIAYLFQEKDYAAVDWKKTCKPGEKYPDKSGQHYQWQTDLNSPKDTIDAITVKGQTVYYFVDSEYWSASLTVNKYRLSVRAKTMAQKIRYFFKNLTDCQTLPNSSPDVVSNVITTTTQSQKPLISSESSVENESKPVSIILIVVVVIVVLFVLAFIAGVVLLAMKKKSETVNSKVETQPKAKAKPPKPKGVKKPKK